MQNWFGFSAFSATYGEIETPRIEGCRRGHFLEGKEAAAARETKSLMKNATQRDAAGGRLASFSSTEHFVGKKEHVPPLTSHFFCGSDCKIYFHVRTCSSIGVCRGRRRRHESFPPPIPCSASAFTPIHHVKEGEEEPSWVCAHLPTSDG